MLLHDAAPSSRVKAHEQTTVLTAMALGPWLLLMSHERYVPSILVAVAAHLDCGWDAEVESFVDGDIVVARRARVRCVRHDFEIGSAEISRHGPVPSKAEMDDAILTEIGRQALVEAAPERMRELSSEELTAVARSFIEGSLDRS